MSKEKNTEPLGLDEIRTAKSDNVIAYDGDLSGLNTFEFMVFMGIEWEYDGKIRVCPTKKLGI